MMTVSNTAAASTTNDPSASASSSPTDTAKPPAMTPFMARLNAQLDAAEKLFLLGSVDQSMQQTRDILDQLILLTCQSGGSSGSSSGSSNDGTSGSGSTVTEYGPLHPSRHECQVACVCEASIGLLFQCAHASHQYDLVDQFAVRYYGDIVQLPIQLFIIWIHFHASLRHYEHMCSSIVAYLQAHKGASTSSSTTSSVDTSSPAQSAPAQLPAYSPSPLSLDDYLKLLELLIFHGLLPCGMYDEAMVILRRNARIPDDRRAEWIATVCAIRDAQREQPLRFDGDDGAAAVHECEREQEQEQEHQHDYEQENGQEHDEPGAIRRIRPDNWAWTPALAEYQHRMQIERDTASAAVAAAAALQQSRQDRRRQHDRHQRRRQRRDEDGENSEGRNGASDSDVGSDGEITDDYDAEEDSNSSNSDSDSTGGEHSEEDSDEDGMRSLLSLDSKMHAYLFPPDSPLHLHGEGGGDDDDGHQRYERRGVARMATATAPATNVVDANETASSSSLASTAAAALAPVTAAAAATRAGAGGLIAARTTTTNSSGGISSVDGLPTKDERLRRLLPWLLRWPYSIVYGAVTRVFGERTARAWASLVFAVYAYRRLVTCTSIAGVLYYRRDMWLVPLQKAWAERRRELQSGHPVSSASSSSSLWAFVQNEARTMMQLAFASGFGRLLL